MSNTKIPYTADDVYRILKQSRLRLKLPLEELPIKEIAEKLNDCVYFYSTRSAVEVDRSPKIKTRHPLAYGPRPGFSFEERHYDLDKIKENLKKIQKYSSRLRECWLEIKDALPRFRYFLRDHYDNHTHLFLSKALSQRLENETIFIEGWAIDTLKKMQRKDYDWRKAGPPRKAALIGMVTSIASCYEKNLINKKLSKNTDSWGPFGRFLYHCLEHVGINEYRSPDEHNQLESDGFECPGNFEPWDWEECQRHQLEKHFPSACPVCPRQNWKPPLKADKPKPTLDKIIKTALKNR